MSHISLLLSVYRYVFFTFDTVYVKHMCENVKMTNWGRVYYTNLMALLPLVFVLPSLGEQEILSTQDWGSQVTFKRNVEHPCC